MMTIKYNYKPQSRTCGRAYAPLVRRLHMENFDPVEAAQRILTEAAVNSFVAVHQTQNTQAKKETIKRQNMLASIISIDGHEQQVQLLNSLTGKANLFSASIYVVQQMLHYTETVNYKKGLVHQFSLENNFITGFTP